MQLENLAAAHDLQGHLWAQLSEAYREIDELRSRLAECEGEQNGQPDRPPVETRNHARRS